MAMPQAILATPLLMRALAPSHPRVSVPVPLAELQPARASLVPPLPPPAAAPLKLAPPSGMPQAQVSTTKVLLLFAFDRMTGTPVTALALLASALPIVTDICSPATPPATSNVRTSAVE